MSFPTRQETQDSLDDINFNGDMFATVAADQELGVALHHLMKVAQAYAVADLVPAREAEDAYDQGVADGQRVMSGIATVWLCIENHPTEWYRVSNLPGGPEHCYFGGGHRVLCGWYELFRQPAPTPVPDDPDVAVSDD